MASRALPLNLCAVTSTLTVSLPSPSTLTSTFLRTRPLDTSSSTPTVPPCGNALFRSPTLTTPYSVRNRLRKPLSLGSRIWIGICPPSKVDGTFLRALVPLVPRPAVLPFEPSPRPTRVFLVLEPGAGFRSCSLMTLIGLPQLRQGGARR